MKHFLKNIFSAFLGVSVFAILILFVGYFLEKCNLLCHDLWYDATHNIGQSCPPTVKKLVDCMHLVRQCVFPMGVYLCMLCKIYLQVHIYFAAETDNQEGAETGNQEACSGMTDMPAVHLKTVGPTGNWAHRQDFVAQEMADYIGYQTLPDWVAEWVAVADTH